MLTFLAILLALALVAMNGFFVAAEFSIVKVRRTRLEELAGQNVKGAQASILCVDALDEYLSATQLGITIVSLALGWIGEASFARLIGYFSPALAAGGKLHYVAAGSSFLLITLLHVVLGELVPKSMAIQRAEETVLAIAKPLSVIYKISRPLIHAFNLMALFVLRRLGYYGTPEAPLTEQELKIMMKESREEGVISESEAQIINRAFEFADKRASDIMVPASQVEFISLERPLDQNLTFVKRHMRTRFPVCRSGFNTAFGIVHMKDVWPVLLTHFSNEAFEKCSRPAIFIDPGLRQDQILKLFQAKQTHMAIVRDPKTQQNSGIVTMEDVLVGIVGDISDEHGN